MGSSIGRALCGEHCLAERSIGRRFGQAMSAFPAGLEVGVHCAIHTAALHFATRRIAFSAVEHLPRCAFEGF